jgi:4-hydroxybenzoate polyprenyltransferase
LRHTVKADHPPAGLWRSARPVEWLKNLVLFAGLIFGRQLTNWTAAAVSLEAFAIFCGLSSAVYLVNDVLDREADRIHPVKKRRPIASGAVSPRTALTTAVVLVAVGLVGAFAINLRFGLVAAAYVVLMILYSTALKHHVILDVLTIASGFLLRALGGAVAIDVPFSHWLLMLTLLLALFLAMSKRRAELVALGLAPRGHRRVLAEYSPALLDQLIGIVTASTLLAYAFYTISPETVARFGTDRLLLTLPFPLYGIFRYLYLSHRRDGGGNPSGTLLSDPPLLVCIALWAIAVIGIIYGPWR